MSTFSKENIVVMSALKRNVLPPYLRFPGGLSLRQRGAQDTQALFELLGQDDFKRNGCTLDPFRSIHELEAFIAGQPSNNLEIVATIDNMLVGFAGIYALSGPQRHVGSFTLSVHERFQNIGIGTVLMNAILAGGLSVMALSRFQATVFADNIRALKLYEKFGFEVEGHLSRFIRRDDQYIDAYLIALIK